MFVIVNRCVVLRHQLQYESARTLFFWLSVPLRKSVRRASAAQLVALLWQSCSHA